MASRSLGAAAAALVAALALIGCGSDSPNRPSDPADPLQAPGAAPVLPELRQVRSVTSGFQDLGAAQAAGYSTKLTECMSDPAGGMGFHYGKGAAIDAQVDLNEPEVLLYEPTAGGGLELVGVEYIVPLNAWAAATPPSLFGQTFHRNDAFGLWALHAWVWKANPSGVFADWNPQVSCSAQ